MKYSCVLDEEKNVDGEITHIGSKVEREVNSKIITAANVASRQSQMTSSFPKFKYLS